MVNWDAKYSAANELLYGDSPSGIVNRAIVGFSDRLGHVLCLGDGEGRQSRALARHGFTVTALDLSVVATQRAREQDQKQGLVVNRLIADAAQPHYKSKYQSGGPDQVDLLYDTDRLQAELAGFSIVYQSCTEAVLDDGPGHQGLAQLTQMICD